MSRRPISEQATRCDQPERQGVLARFVGFLGRGLRHLVFPVLAAAVVSGVLLIGMFPARAYLDQKEAIADAQTRLNQLTETNKQAEDELARLNTDSEIEKVAREQYGLVKPGEEVYHVMPVPQDPITVPDAWPFDGMRKRMGAPPAADPAPSSPPTSVAPLGGPAPSISPPASPPATR